MPRTPQFIISESSIKAFFRGQDEKVFTEAQLRETFQIRRGLWNLPLTMTPEKFVDRLVNRGVLTREEIFFEGYMGRKERFMVEGASPFEVAVSLKPRAYLSHYTAVYLNGLTTQVPKVIYTSYEQTPKLHVGDDLTQSDIDAAFAQPQRKAGSRAQYKDYTIVLLNPKNTGHIGVIYADNLPVTGPERTLIDIAVRPAYAGGVQSVLDAYQRALPEISMNKLLATLATMDFIYPYHQAIGFYLERAGCESKKMEELRSMPRHFDFYLTYEMKDTAYSNEWNLYYPKGM